MSRERVYQLADGQELHCGETVRLLPEKREACLGTLDGSPVFAKLFLDSRRGKIHWQRELDGIKALQQRGILTAELLYAGVVGDDDLPLIVLAQLPGPVTMRTAWDEADPGGVQQLLEDMVTVLAKHHLAGVCQTDLHLDNFVISEGQIYSLDGAGVTVVEGELGLQQGLDNLALFMAQLAPRWATYAPTIYEFYLAARGVEQGPGSEYLSQQIERLREWRWNRFKGKLFRDCTAFRFSKSSDRVEIVVRQYATPEFDALLRDPDATYPGREGALKNGITCTVWSAKVDSLPVVIKRYNAQGVFKGLIRRFVRGRAMLSWENAHMLGFYGVSTPRPLAVLQRRVGCWNTTSYFMTREMDGICIYYWLLDDVRSSAEIRQMVRQVVELLVQLHKHKISHGDMKVANWFVEHGEVVLIDLDTMHRHRCDILFRRAWRSDVRRFMQNWEKLPELQALFRDEFDAQGLDWR